MKFREVHLTTLLRRSLLAACLTLFGAAGARTKPASGAAFPGPDARPANAQAREELKNVGEKLPLRFEANRGQADARAKFISRGDGYNLYLTGREAVLDLQKAALALRFVGANVAPRVVGRDELPGRSNYFIGRDARQWHTSVPQFGGVECDELYPGITAVFYGRGRQLEYDFVVQPGADPLRIKLEFAGAESLRVNEAGDLVIRTAAGEVRQHRPVIYQEVGGRRREVAGGYVIDARRRVTFRLGAYDAARPLVIDPVLSFAAFLAEVNGTAMRVDTAGNIYLTGTTTSLGFPVAANSAQRRRASGFVMKLNPDATAVLYSTYFGGASNLDSPNDIAVDGQGNAYITGLAGSTDFPVTEGAFQTTFQGPGQIGSGFNGDAFVAKLDATGSTLLYSTYLGGSNSGEIGYGIAVNAAGEAFVTGATSSTNFPVTPGVVQGFKADLFSTGFVTRLNANGSAPVYSTYFGSGTRYTGEAIAVDAAGNAYVTGESYPDILVFKLNATGSAYLYQKKLSGGGYYSEGFALAVDGVGNAYVTGRTTAQSLPTTATAFQRTYGGGGYDAFAAKLGPTGTTLYLTYLGGSGADEAAGLAVDAAGNVVITGKTDSTNFPTAPGALQPVLNQLAGQNSGSNNRTDAFVTKLNSSASALLYSTYLGSNENDDGRAVALDPAGRPVVMGGTGIVEPPGLPFPFGGALRTKPVVQATNPGFYGAFIARLDESLASAPDLAVTLTRTGEFISQGYSAYVVKVTNVGTTPSLGAVRLTQALTYPRMSGDGWVCPQYPSGQFICTYPASLAPGESATLLLEFPISGQPGTSVSHTVKIENGSDTNPANDTASDTTTVISPCALTGMSPIDNKPDWRGGAFRFTFASPGDCNWRAVSNATWITVTSGAGPGDGAVTYTVAANETGAERVGTISLGGRVHTVTQSPRPLTASISAASYLTVNGRKPPVATESIVSVFGTNLATATEGVTALPLPTTLAGTTVMVQDFFGVGRLAPLFFVSPLQVNYQIPPGTATGEATVTITNANGEASTERLQIAPFMPGVFTANGTGSGVPAAYLQRVKADGSQVIEPVFDYDEAAKQYVPHPIDFGPDLGANSDRLYLVLFGTGIRGRSALEKVGIVTGPGGATALYAGPQGGFVGLDQANFLLPRTWAGYQTTYLKLYVDGQESNWMQIRFK